MSSKPAPVFMLPTPSVIDLADEAMTKQHTGFSPETCLKLAQTEGFPVRVRGKKTGRRYYVLMSECQDWWRGKPEVASE